MLKRVIGVCAAVMLTLPLLSSAQSVCPTLSIGSSGASVTAVQQILYNAYSNFPTPTGYFGPLTQAALKQWQKDHGIQQTGTVGPLTGAAMKLCTNVQTVSSTPTTAATPVSSGVTAPTLISSITRTLSRGLSGADVSALQQFLISQNLLTADSATGYFGALTEAAVQQWQAQHAVVSAGTPATTGYGALGPKTRSAMVSISSAVPTGGASYVPPPSSTASVISPASPTQTTVQPVITTGGGGVGSTPSTSSCVWNNQSIVNGATVNAYLYPSIDFGQSCTRETRTCNNGTLSGSYAAASCVIAPAASCTLSGVTVASGDSHTFYSDAGVAAGDSCSNYAQSRTCTNGTLSGSSAYNQGSCVVGAPNACTFGGQSLTSGASVTAYQSASVPFGQTCTSQQRTCTNGTLSGSYNASACTVAAAASCTFNGASVVSAASVTAYQSSTVASGQTCASQTRTCTNGTLSGTYTASTCTVTPSVPATCNLHDGAAAAQLKSLLSNGCTTITTDANAHVTLTSGDTITVPSGTTLVFNAGSRWTIGAGTTVSVQGGYQVPLQRAQFFDGAGQITSTDSYDSLGCPVTQRVVYPEWFGAKVGDGADDSVAMLAALAFGNHLDLAAGTYDIQNRLPLLGHQSIVGAGTGLTIMSQMANFNLVAYTPNVPPYSDIFVQDFIVSPTSDCSSISNLTIDGSRLPNGVVAPGATWGALMTAVQISSSYGWRLGQPPVKNTTVKNVGIVSPLSGCINIQSNRGVDGVLIDGVSCTARTGGNTFGVTIEGYDPSYANQYKNVTIQNSTFTGGTTVFYIAGVTNLVMNNDTLTAQTGSNMAMLWYTGDVGFKSTGTITNSRFTFDAPDGNGDSVIRIDARGYVKDYEQPLGNSVFPYLQDVGSTLSMDSDTISSAATTIPLIRDEIGLSKPLKITNSTLTGGSYGILAGNPSDPTDFGATLFVMQPNGSYSPQALTPDEIATFHIQHSDLDIENSTFTRQAFSSINVMQDAVKITGNTFNNIGTSPAALDYPIIRLGGLSPFDTGPAPQSSITNNSYSGVNASALALVPNISGQLLFSGNTAFAFDGQSKPASTMDGVRLNGNCSGCQSPPPSAPTNPINVACPSNYLTNGVCSLSHIFGLHAQSGLDITFHSWVHPGLVYVINFGDGVEQQIPVCTLPLSGQPNSCTDAGYFTHTYTAAGTYYVSVIDYSCPSGSTSCNQAIDSTSVTVSNTASSKDASANLANALTALESALQRFLTGGH